ncbi:MAG: HAD hydrolase-like protein [Patescibacteria group bacterium]
MLPHIDLVISDWSGVISDDRRTVHEALMRMLAKRGIARMSYTDWEQTARVSPRKFLTSMSELKVFGTFEELADEYEETFNLVSFEGLRPEVFPDVQDFLSHIKLNLPGTVVVVASSHPQKYLEDEAKLFGVHGLIKDFVGDAHEKITALKGVLGGVPANRAVYVCDSRYDICAARGAGITAIGIPTGYHSETELCGELNSTRGPSPVIVHSLADAIPLLRH